MGYLPALAGSSAANVRRGQSAKGRARPPVIATRCAQAPSPAVATRRAQGPPPVGASWIAQGAACKASPGIRGQDESLAPGGAAVKSRNGDWAHVGRRCETTTSGPSRGRRIGMHWFPRACLRLRPRLPTFGPCRGRAEGGGPTPKTLVHPSRPPPRGRSRRADSPVPRNCRPGGFL